MLCMVCTKHIPYRWMDEGCFDLKDTVTDEWTQLDTSYVPPSTKTKVYGIHLQH